VARCTRTAATRCSAALGILLFSYVLFLVDHVDQPVGPSQRCLAVHHFFFANSYTTLFICPMQLYYSRRYLQIRSRQPVNRVAWQKIFPAGLAPMQDNYSACKYVAGQSRARKFSRLDWLWLQHIVLFPRHRPQSPLIVIGFKSMVCSNCSNPNTSIVLQTETVVRLASSRAGTLGFRCRSPSRREPMCSR
jgi:hypothetical protein